MRLVTAMVVRNEADRYLREVIEQCRTFSHVVVLDDASTDTTPDLAADLGAEVHRLSEPMWQTDEGMVRATLYRLAMRHEPEWLYVPDADEVLEEPGRIARLLDRQGPYTFEMWHAWGSREKFRVDGYWIGQNATRLFRPPTDSEWRAMPIHCGSAPASVLKQRKVPSGLRIFHYGYADPDDALRKYALYSMLDPEGKHSPQSHYDSMLTTPSLVYADGEPTDGGRIRIVRQSQWGVSTGGKA